MRHGLGIVFLALTALPFLMRAPASAPSSDASENMGLDTGGDVEVLVIVSPHRRELQEEYSRAFPEYMARAHGRRVRISWRDPGGGTEAILKDLEARYRQDAGPGADLFFGGGVRPHLRAKKAGWLTPVELPDELLAAIPPTVAGQQVFDPERYWFGVALSSFGIIYHAEQVERLGRPFPTEWGDLAHPAFAGWIASGDPRTSGVVHTCHQTVLQAYGFDAGWRMLAAMAANTRVFGEGAAVAPTEVASGDAAAGMVIENYADTTLRNANDPALRFVLPAGLTLCNADAISMLRGAEHPDLAALFIEYCLGEEGQALLIRPAGVEGQLREQRRFPVRADCYTGDFAPATNPYDAKNAFEYDDPLAELRAPILNDLAGAWFVDTHPHLAAAWRAVIARGFDPDEVARLTAPPVTDEAMRALAHRWRAMGDDPAQQAALNRERAATRRAWSIEARERYTAFSRK